MADSRIYYLTECKRLLNFPIRLREVGWLPGHSYIHRNVVIENVYICMSCNKLDSSLSIVNGELVLADKNPGKIFFHLIEPGTRLNTIKEAIHDELFFRFDDESAAAVMKLVGSCRRFSFEEWPFELMVELLQLLKQLDKVGTADKVDQMAVRIISEIIIRHIEKSEQNKNSRQLRIYSAANGLLAGKSLREAAQENGFSIRSFYREWEKCFNVSPKNYVMNKRIEKARQLLDNTELSNMEIARRCGFGDTKYFYQWFQIHFSMSPQEFRKSNRCRDTDGQVGAESD